MNIQKTNLPETLERVAIAGLGCRGVPSIGIETRAIGTPTKPYELLSIEAFDAWLSSCPKPHCTALYEEARALVLEREKRQEVENPSVLHADSEPESPRG